MPLTPKIATIKGRSDNLKECIHGIIKQGSYLFNATWKDDFNTLDRVQGWADSPLTEEGALVAHDLGRGLKGTNFVAAYASDRGRAIETARIVMKESDNYHLKLEKLAEMREFGFGKFEGNIIKLF